MPLIWRIAESYQLIHPLPLSHLLAGITRRRLAGGYDLGVLGRADLAGDVG